MKKSNHLFPKNSSTYKELPKMKIVHFDSHSFFFVLSSTKAHSLNKLGKIPLTFHGCLN
jgi:hypothetical protein